MTSPESPSALLFALVPALLFIAIAYWRFAFLRAYSLFSIIVFAVGAAVVFATLIVAVSYASSQFASLRSSVWFLAVPIVSYVGLLAAAGRRALVPARALIFGGLIGLIPLCFLGIYAVFMAACSFGDCL